MDDDADAVRRVIEEAMRVGLEQYRVRVNEKIELDRPDFERRWEQLSEAFKGADGDIVLALLARTLDALEAMGLPQQWALTMLSLRAGLMVDPDFVEAAGKPDPSA